MNTRAKGNRLELKAVNDLKLDGWKAYRVPASQMWQKQQDIFGLWDIIACKEGSFSQGGMFRFIQVRANQTRDISEHRMFAATYKHDNITYEVWVWKDYADDFTRIIL